ncbi:transposase (fragment) [Xanthomonas citri pv. citri]
MLPGGELLRPARTREDRATLLLPKGAVRAEALDYIGMFNTPDATQVQLATCFLRV